MSVYVPNQQLLTWKVCVTILHAIAVAMTGLRLEHRRRMRRLWWDDRAAIVPAVLQIINVSVMWLRMRNQANVPFKWRLFYSYANSFCFGSIVWWSRISLALAVVRITPIWSKCRPLAIGMAGAFFVFWLCLVSAMMLTCAIHTHWQHSPNQILICGPAYYVAVVVFILDIIGDIALIGVPLRLLWNMKHPTSYRAHAVFVFSASVLTLISSVGLCIVSYGKFIVGPGRLILWLMVCQVTEGISMITANLLVLICWLRYHVLHDSSSFDQDCVPNAQAAEILGQNVHFISETTSNPSLQLATRGPMDTFSPSREGQLNKNNSEVLHQAQEAETGR